MNKSTRFLGIFFALLFSSQLTGQQLELSLRSQSPRIGEQNSMSTATFQTELRNESWNGAETAVIICDMWDSHTSVNAVRRVNELAPRINSFVSRLREQGAIVIHAPSSCMPHYEGHAARVRAINTPPAGKWPDDIENWCYQIPSEETANYPIDQSDGGSDDNLLEHKQWVEHLVASGRKAVGPWLSQHPGISVDASADFISDSGREIWNVLRHNSIQNVMLVGVHTNMCVLGRPFGLRRLSSAGLNTILVRDLTDTMYSPESWPYANHFTGTDRIVGHIERFVCPTITSNQILGGQRFQFSRDDRFKLAIIIAEDEYGTDVSLNEFASKHLSGHFQTTFCYGNPSERYDIPGVLDVADADALLISVRRRALPQSQLDLIRTFVLSGKPIIGIRTASHAFEVRKGTPVNKSSQEPLAEWPEFDAEVWGGSYDGHFANDLLPTITVDSSEVGHPIIEAVGSKTWKSSGSLYRTAPLGAGTLPLVSGEISDTDRKEWPRQQPVAWTNVRLDGGRSFYTSLGHRDDFKQPEFETLLSAGIHWACGLPLPTYQEIVDQDLRYAKGSGKAR